MKGVVVPVVVGLVVHEFLARRGPSAAASGALAVGAVGAPSATAAASSAVAAGTIPAGARAFGAFAVGVGVLAPAIGVALAAGCLLVVVHRRLGRRRHAAARADADIALLTDLVALGLGAGMSFPAALGAAAPGVDDLLAAEIAAVLRSARLDGVGSALAAADGRAAGLFRVVARASVTGAPVLDAVAAYGREVRAEATARRTAEARKLPVRLLFPLALLILPGFLLITVGPALLGAVRHLDL